MPRKGMRSIFSSPNRSELSADSSFPTPRRSFRESLMAQVLKQAEPIITKWDEDSSGYAKITSLFYENRREASEFIKQVNELHKAMHTLITENSSSQMLVRAQILMQMAMKRLQKEFYQILSANRAYLDPESVSSRSSVSTVSSSSLSIRSSTSDYGNDSEDEIQAVDRLYKEVENASTATINDLALIAECMISSGYGKECVNTYKIMRKSIVDEGIYKLGVEKTSSSKIHKMDWEVLDLRIKNWLSAVNVAVNTLFHGERILCDQVFAASDSVRELCFYEITKEGATLLFGFPENAVKNNRKSPEKIFRALDMYTTIAYNWPEIESIFSSDSTSAILNLAVDSTIILRDSVRSAFTEFEKFIQKESLKIPEAGAVVHRLTTDVMNFLSRLADYNALQDILFDYTMPTIPSLPESYFLTFGAEEYPAMEVSLHIAWLILVLLCKLDGKAKQHKDVSYSYLFLANNLKHITSKVRTSNLKFLLGDSWISKHEAKLKSFASKYERFGWSHVIASLPVNPTAVMSPEIRRECLRRFNDVFEEAHQKQSLCVIQDSKLRDEIKLSIANKLLPVYQELYNAHVIEMKRERSLARVVRYTPDNLGHALSDLFFGSGSPTTTFTASASVTALHLESPS